MTHIYTNIYCSTQTFRIHSSFTGVYQQSFIPVQNDANLVLIERLRCNPWGGKNTTIPLTFFFQHFPPSKQNGSSKIQIFRQEMMSWLHSGKPGNLQELITFFSCIVDINLTCRYLKGKNHTVPQ